MKFSPLKAWLGNSGTSGSRKHCKEPWL